MPENYRKKREVNLKFAFFYVRLPIRQLVLCTLGEIYRQINQQTLLHSLSGYRPLQDL